jgi:hypothetical protein
MIATASRTDDRIDLSVTPMLPLADLFKALSPQFVAAGARVALLWRHRMEGS